MTKCLSCGHSRHDLELNCPKCGSFYSTMVDDFSPDEVEAEKKNLLTRMKASLETQKNRWIAMGIVAFVVIVVFFL